MAILAIVVGSAVYGCGFVAIHHGLEFRDDAERPVQRFAAATVWPVVLLVFLWWVFIGEATIRRERED